MEDYGTEYQDSKKIFFIYSQNGYMNEINEIKKNQYLKETRLLKEIQNASELNAIYCLILEENYDKQPITLEFEVGDEICSTDIKVNDLLSEIFLFKIDLKNRKDLKKENLLLKEKFKMFLDLKDSGLEIGFSEDFLKNLCLSSIKFIASTHDKYNLDFLFYVFIYSYCLQKVNSEENLIKQLFEAFTIKNIDANNDIKYKRNDKLNINFENSNKILNSFLNINNILNELVKFSGIENIQKIHIILAYYYLKYNPKYFIYLISNNCEYTKDIYANLTNNRALFSNFSSKIINLDIFAEAENLQQIENLLRLLPNMQELFNIFLITEIFLKVRCLCYPNKYISINRILTPKIDDDVEKIYSYFLIISQMCKNENSHMILSLSDDFFLSYANFYVKVNLEKLKIIKEMYKNYISISNIKNTALKEDLNDLYYTTGIQIIKKTNSLKNKDLINFFEESGKTDINITSDLLDRISEMIDFKSANEKFKYDFLNNNFKKFDLKNVFKEGFSKFMEKIFEKFKTQSDFSIIKNWKINPNVNEEVLEMCLKRLKNVLINEKKNNESKKFIIYKDLYQFICDLFSLSSSKLDKSYFIKELKDLESYLPNSNLIEIYFKILKDEEKSYPISDNFRKHIKEYIKNKSGSGPLSIWYNLVLTEKSEKVNYLCSNLKPEHAVKKEDFADYSFKIEESIYLFKYLYDSKYFDNLYITNLDYYKNSLNAKKEIINLSYEKGIKIFNNYDKYKKLFRLFIPDKRAYEKEYKSFYDEVKKYKTDFESLETINKYWNNFFYIVKKNDIISLTELIETLKATPLSQFNSKKIDIETYLNYLKEAKNGCRLFNSLIFMGLYNIYKKIFAEEKQSEHFNYTHKEFEKLKTLNKNTNIKDFDKDLISSIVECAKSGEKKILDELDFIRDYFGLNKNNNSEDKQDEFDVNKILTEIYNIVPKSKIFENNVKPNNTPNQEQEKKKDAKIPVITANIEKINKIFQDYFNFYKNIQDINDLFLEKFINVFKNIFKDKEIDKLQPQDFKEKIIDELYKVYDTGLSYDIHNYSGENKEVYLINDFFEIINVFNNIYKNDIYTYSINIKKLFSIFLNRMNYNGFSKDFTLIKSLFSEIISSNSDYKNEFYNCFINILIQLIKKENFKTGCNDLQDILQYAVNLSIQMIDECIPLINELFDENFILEKIRTTNFTFNYLNKFDKQLGNSLKLREQLLYYFESNINRIFDIYYKETLTKDDLIIKYIKGGVSFLENESNYKDKKTDENNKNKENKENKNNISLLFIIAFLKIFIKKYIYAVKENINVKEEKFKDIVSSNDNFSYYIVKLYLDSKGSFESIAKENLFYLSKNVAKEETINENKYFGFDYIFLPMDKKEAQEMANIFKTFNLENLKGDNPQDLALIDDLNKNIDIFYCFITNIFLSKFSGDYFSNEEYKILFNWLNSRIGKFIILKDNSIIKTLINGKIIRKINNNELKIILFALRIVLYSLSIDNDKDKKNKNKIIFVNNKYKHIFYNYFKNNNEENNDEININSNIDRESFHIKRFILLSHLFYAFLLEKINMNEIKEITYYKFDNDDEYLLKALNVEFETIIKLLGYKGIKNKYNIIIINIIFDRIKSKYYHEWEKSDTVTSIIDDDYYSEKIKNYFKLLKEIDLYRYMGMNELKKIIFEDIDYYKENVNKDSYLYYLTTPNFCSIDDFTYQLQFFKGNYPIIELTLKKEIDTIINIINCLPEINNIINKIYYQYVLTINREEYENIIVNLDNYEIFNNSIKKIKEYLNINIEDLTNRPKLSEIINIKDNNIYKMYEDIIKKYNDFLSKVLNKEENKNNMKPKNYLKQIMIQDFSERNIFKLKKNNSFNRLMELICIYSKRNRYKIENGNEVLNVIDGDKIYYNFDLIEKKLEKELVLGKNYLKTNQRTFIFSNEAFAGERNNILSDLMTKYHQEKISKKKTDEIEKQLENLNKDKINKKYYTLQYMIIYLINNYNTDVDPKQISLKKLNEDIFKKYPRLDKFFNFEDINISNIISLYEIIEKYYFTKNEDDIKPKDIKNEKKEDINKYFEKSNLVLNKDILSEVVKKYYLRYCLGDYETKNDILKNMDINKIFAKKDICEEKLFSKENSKKEIEDLKTLNQNNNNYLINYLLCDIFKLEEKDDIEIDLPPEEESEEEQE